MTGQSGVRKRLPKNQRGIALVVVLLVAGLLTLLGATFLTISSTESNISYNELNKARAFNLAEAGIGHARRELITTNVNPIPAGPPEGSLINFTGYGTAVSSAGGTYRVTVTNNATGFPRGSIAVDGGGATNDTDRILVLTSTGTYKNATLALEAVANVPSVLPPGPISSSGPGSRIRREDQAEINGNNYIPPALPCAGAACGGTADPSVPARPGIVSNSADVSVEQSGTGAVIGSPTPTQVDPTFSTTSWGNLATSLIPQASITPSGDIFTSVTWGTPSAPAITVISGTVKIRDSGGAMTGAGILIVDGNSSGRLEIEGPANYQGLIIVIGDGRIRIRPKDPARADIFGGIVMVGQTADPTDPLDPAEASPRFRIQKQSTLRFSRAALQTASSLVVTSILSWREVR